MHEPFSEYVEKEKNREELHKALGATSRRSEWRNSLIICLFLLVIGGAFFSRAKNFSETLNRLARGMPIKSKALSKAEGPARNSVISAEEDMQEEYADLEKQRAGVARLEKLTGHSVVVPKMGEATIKNEEQTGISNGEHEQPLLMFGEGDKPGDPQYYLKNKIPTAYSGEPEEFPDFH